MPSITQCPGCSQKLRIPDNLLGQLGRCPICSVEFALAPIPGNPDEELPGPVASAGLQPIAAPIDVALEHCPSCGQMIPTSANPCPRCGAELEEDEALPAGFVHRDCEPHRGTTVLTLGIISLVMVPTLCCGTIGALSLIIGTSLGITAIALGRRDLRMMREGSMDPAGYGPTHAGYVCGIVGVCLNGLMLLLGVLVVVFGFFFLQWFGKMAPRAAPPPPTPPAKQSLTGIVFLQWRECPQGTSRIIPVASRP
jgi:hypothetical protein